MNRLLLGSSSPRRKEILSFFHCPFSVVKPPFDEESVPYHGDGGAFAREVAYQKALSLAPSFPGQVILTADTIVCHKGALFQKPSSLKEAHEMLLALSGTTHEVFSGVAIALDDWVETDVERTEVQFFPLSSKEIDIYHRAFNPLDKSGSYTVEGGGSIIVKRVTGCYYNILGLPIEKTRRLLLRAGINLWDTLASSSRR